jgi:hypothetical protein
MVLGDLEEQLPGRSQTWYWRQALSVVGHAVIRRAGPATGAPRRGRITMSLLRDIRYAWRSLS